jgi:hypothetical protein
METRPETRRGFLGRLPKFGVLAAVSFPEAKAQTDPPWRRGWGGREHPRYRFSARRRFYGGGYHGGLHDRGYHGGTYMRPAPAVPAAPYAVPAPFMPAPVPPYYRGYGGIIPPPM